MFAQKAPAGMLLTAGWLLSAMLVGPVQAALSLPGLYNTGYDSSGNLIVTGQADAHYILNSAPYVLTSTTTFATDTAAPAWVPNDSTSLWITPEGYQHPPFSGENPDWPATAPQGIYVYDLTFFVPAGALPYLVITGNWASDNPAEMRLNPSIVGSGAPDGTFVSDTPGYPNADAAAYSSFTSFAIASGFVAGWNTLEFTVNNLSGTSGNPTGIDVRFNAPVVPEATTLASWGGLTLIGALLVRRRRR